MEVLRNGKFSLPIQSGNLSKGLRPEENSVINSHTLLECQGVVGVEGILKRCEELIRTYNISGDFPYPQIFVETNVIIICNETTIYEVDGDDLYEKYFFTEASTWSLISVHDFVYMSNGVLSIVRNPESKVYELSEAPHGMAICNYNGQIIVGAPNASYS